jgi:hypothetical protein
LKLFFLSVLALLSFILTFSPFGLTFLVSNEPSSSSTSSLSLAAFGDEFVAMSHFTVAISDPLEHAFRRVQDSTVGKFVRAVAACFVLAVIASFKRTTPESVHWTNEVSHCKLLVSESPVDVASAPNFCLGYGAQLRAQWQDAFSYYKKSYECEPCSCEAWCAAASVWVKMESREHDAELLSAGGNLRADSTLPDDLRAGVCTLLGRIAHVEQRFEDAEKLLDEANRLRPGDVGTLRFLGGLALDDRQPGGAKAVIAAEFLEQALKLCPDSTDVLLDLADMNRLLAHKHKKGRETYVTKCNELLDQVVRLVNDQSIIGRRSHIYERCASAAFYLPWTQDRTTRVLLFVDAGLAALQRSDEKHDQLRLSLNYIAFRCYHDPRKPDRFVQGRSLQYAWNIVRMGAPTEKKARECVDFVVAECDRRTENWGAFAGQLPPHVDMQSWYPLVSKIEVLLWTKFVRTPLADDDEAVIKTPLFGVTEKAMSNAMPSADSAREEILALLKLAEEHKDTLPNVERWLRRQCMSDIRRVVSYTLEDSVAADTRLVSEYRRLWSIVRKSPSQLLFRADYAHNNTERNGITALDPDERSYTVEQHINEGSLKTRFVSFSTTLAVAVMHWAKSKKNGELRALVAVDPTHFQFRLWSVVDRDALQRSVAQARSTADREVIVEFASRSLPPSAICYVYDAENCYKKSQAFKKLVDWTGSATGFDKFAGKYADLGAEAELALYRREPQKFRGTVQK